MFILSSTLINFNVRYSFVLFCGYTIHCGVKTELSIMVTLPRRNAMKLIDNNCRFAPQIFEHCSFVKDFV
jgi:hypothetical protein